MPLQNALKDLLVNCTIVTHDFANLPCSSGKLGIEERIGLLLEIIPAISISGRLAGKSSASLDVQLSDGRGIPVVLKGDILGHLIVSRGFVLLLGYRSHPTVELVSLHAVVREFLWLLGY